MFGTNNLIKELAQHQKMPNMMKLGRSSSSHILPEPLQCLVEN
jgi:hypothetical protein